MSAEIEQARELIRRSLSFRDEGRPEAVLRSEIQSRLRQVFPGTEDESWVNHYSAGTEAHTRLTGEGGKTANRFIDNLIGATSIEYEADLRVKAKFAEGTRQAAEHAVGLLRSGVPASQIRCIVSDTLDWYVYDVVLKDDINPAICTPSNIELVASDTLKITRADATSAEKLAAFLRKHLAREQSRPLLAEYLAADLGLESPLHGRLSDPIIRLIDEARANDTSVALATDLWSRFVDFLEGQQGGFRTSAYADEVYLSFLARLLSANILAEQAILSDDDELKSILGGAYFSDRYQLQNMVELDYFGWLVRADRIDALIPTAREIQRDLLAYDFSYRPEEDLFGRLMAQLANRSQRKLLGQEWTPAWLAAQLASECFSRLPSEEPPRIVDMCCGSGSILIAVLKEARSRLGLASIETLHDVATGFDIDPLAVQLAKTSWVATLATEIKAATAPVFIPVYHADSLFAVTPVSATLPIIGDEDEIAITLDGYTIKLPNALLQPDYRELFDSITDWAYDEARTAQSTGQKIDRAKLDAAKFLSGAAANAGTKLPDDLKAALVPGVTDLVCRMSDLAVANRNGIWAFILRNTYRPALLTGQFNGLVSNPPWLAMSGLANNPYRELLTERARLYGIRPAGQSFLHLELGTTHLLHAIDRYLKPDAAIACLVPGTVLRGHHHEKLRQKDYLTAPRPVPFDLQAIWQVEPGTFKYPGIALIGTKRATTAQAKAEPLKGAVAAPDGLTDATVTVRRLGADRSAWLLESGGMPVSAGGMVDLPQQGADLMPRTAICVEVLDRNGGEWRVDTPSASSPWGFTVKAAKELKDSRFPGRAAPEFVYRIAQSENLLPFVLGDHCAPIVIPAERSADGSWTVLDDEEIRRQGFIQTARRFASIDAQLSKVGQQKTLQQRIDERGKLKKQRFAVEGYLVLAGAGGKHICAACLPVTEAADLVIDQTLYWKVFSSSDEAQFYTGMLNSQAMTAAITPFNPKGAFGERHIHALPYRLLPAFDPDNTDHARIAELSRDAATLARSMIAADDYLNDPNRQLHIRRTRLREALQDQPIMQELEKLCVIELGVEGTNDADQAIVEE